MKIDIHYDIKLPEKINDILSADFWMLDHCTHQLLSSNSELLKFTSSVSVYVRKGSAIADINLMTQQIHSPCIVNIHKSQILQMKYVSEDFDAVFIVLSKKFTDNLFFLLKDSRVYHIACSQQMVTIPEELVEDFEENIRIMSKISKDSDNPFAFQAQVLAISSFFYQTGYKCYLPLVDNMNKSNNRIMDQFLNLVQQNYKKERFLDFYASKLEITPKHLSRTLKLLTGSTAVEWIERYVILDAKVMLKSTNMNVQEIANELNFPSQSFSGNILKRSLECLLKNSVTRNIIFDLSIS